jgi:hypothetical protein
MESDMLDTPATTNVKPHPTFDPDGRLNLMIQVAGLLDAAYLLHFDGVQNNTAGNALACTIDQARTELARLRNTVGEKPLEHATPTWAKNPTVPGQLIELFGNMTDEALAGLCPDDRARIGELCRDVAERADAATSDPKDARSAREAKALVGMRDLTFEDVKAMSPHGLSVLGSYCRRIDSLIMNAEQEAAR